MAIFTLANLKKAYRYGRKNGFLPAFYAAVERTFYQKERYEKRILQPEERRAQEETLWEHREMFSILVPAYDTQIGHFHEMWAYSPLFSKGIKFQLLGKGRHSL